jgi:hypothetical protein
MGRLDEAREIVNQLRTVMPGAPPGASPYRNLEHRELYLLSVRLAMGETA